MTSLARVAWHEAGHAVAAVLLDHGLDHVTLGDDGNGPRCVTVRAAHIVKAWKADAFDDPELRAFLKRELIGLACGTVAELHKFPDCGARLDPVQDGRMIASICRDLGDVVDLDGIARRGADLLADHWGHVARVARALIEHKALSADQVRAQSLNRSTVSR